MTHSGVVGVVRLSRGRRQRRIGVVAAVVATGAAAVLIPVTAGHASHRAATALVRLPPVGSGSGVAWPATGQAAYSLGGAVVAGPGSRPVPIASVAKVMTAYVVLRDHPLAGVDQGPTIVVNDAEAAQYRSRRADGQSGVPLRTGEHITERQALQALLLPSANDIAVVLARWDAGSQAAFIAEENATARRLGLADTTYTDPGGFDAGTVSTAADQTVLLSTAFGEPAFLQIVAERSAVIPVAGTIVTTDSLLGTDGFVGGKTGSTMAAGGCFVFRDVRVVHGRRTVVTGAVLGQPGPGLIQAALAAAQTLVDSLGDEPGT